MANTANEIISADDMLKGTNADFIKIQLLKEILAVLKTIEINTRKV